MLIINYMMTLNSHFAEHFKQGKKTVARIDQLVDALGSLIHFVN